MSINRALIILGLLLLSFGARAHQPDLSSTMLVEQGKNNWVLQIRAALTAFEYEVHQHFGENSYATPEEFQDLVLRHVEENLAIRLDKNELASLQNGLVKLGHETSVVFKIIGMPETIESLEVTNTSFKNIYHNQSALIVLKEGFSKKQFTLDNDNEHTAKLKVSDTTFELVSTAQEKTSYSSFWLLGIALVVLPILFFLYKSKT